MFLPDPSESQTEFELAPEGVHTARCYMVVDLGEQEVVWEGVAKWQRKIRIGWELPDELMADGRPFSVYKEYTWSMHEKGKLRPDLEAWRGKKFGEEDFRGPNRFNTKKLIGAPCLIQVIHEKGKRNPDRVYANVSRVSALPKNTMVKPAVNAPVYLGLDKFHWDVEAFNRLPDWLKEKIQKSPTYHELFDHPNPTAKAQGYAEDLDDAVPF